MTRKSVPSPRWLPFLAAIAVLLVSVGAVRADGTLDTTFGAGGIELDSAGTGVTAAPAAAALTSGLKIVTAGTATSGSTSELLVSRHLRNGPLDTSFDAAGPVPGVLRIPIPGAREVQGTAVVLRSDTGRALVGGWADFGTVFLPDVRFLLAAVSSDGHLDTSFNPPGALAPGIVVTSVGDGSDATAAAAVQLSDHSLILVGTARDAGINKVAAVKYQADGSLDPTFGSSGKDLYSVPPSGGGAGDDDGFAAALTSDGLLIAGSSLRSGHQGFLVLRVGAATGSLDAGFGSGGFVRIELGDGGLSQAFGVAGNSAGDVYAAGYATDQGSSKFALVALDSSGSLLPFGTSGHVLTSMGSDGQAGAGAIEVTLNGRILLGGAAVDAGRHELALARYLPTGALDTSFGPTHDGKLLVPAGSGAAASGAALVDALLVQRPILVGSVDNGGQGEIALVRVIGDDAYFPTLTVTSPQANQFFGVPPSPIVVSGTFRADLGTAGICAFAGTGVISSPPPTASCNRYAGYTGGPFTVNATGTLPQGNDWISVFIRDLQGHLQHQFVPVEIASTGSHIDLRVTGIEITQGVQLQNATVSPTPGASSITYNGVQLTDVKRTVVRVYADAASLHGSSVAIPAIRAELRVSCNGHDAGLFPADGGPRALVLGPAGTTVLERSAPALGYTFSIGYLPAGRCALRAVLNPPPDAVPECPACLGDDTLQLLSIPVHYAHWQTLTPLRVQATFNGMTTAPTTNVNDAFGKLVEITPFELFVHDYIDTIDASRVTDGTDSSAENSHYEDLVSDYFHDNHVPGRYLVGVNLDQVSGTTVTHTYAWPPFGSFTSITNEDRPLTSVAHEVGHQEGRPHADFIDPSPPGCGGNSNGQVGEPWPPDNRGELQGFGMEIPTDGTIEAYPILAPGTAGLRTGDPLPGQFVDLMSYCEHAYPEDNSWMSPRNWDRLVNEHAEPLPSAPFADHPPPGPKGPALDVSAMIGADGKAEIVHVRPSLQPAQGSVKSPYAFVVRDASGKLVSETDVQAFPAHVDAPKHGPGQVYLTLAGDVPAGTKPASLELTDNGKPMAVQKASAHAPVVHVLAPGRGQHVGARGSVTVRWQGSDADGDPLETTIDYSSDGGHTFRTIEQGTEGTSFRLPARYFSASHNARLRLRVSDGFNETRALSAPFRVAGAPPDVKIEGSPRRLQLRADATLALAGYAFSESGRLFRDNRLRWFEGKRLVGVGPHLVQAGLPVGTRRLQLRVRIGGRTGVASVVLSVRPVTPQFLMLRMPKRLSPRARRVAFRVMASAPARLTVTLRKHVTSFVVGRSERLIYLGVPATAKPLRLVLRLSLAGHRSRAVAVTILR